MQTDHNSSRLEVKLLDISDDRWIPFAVSRPNSSMFHHPSWALALAECYGHRPFIVAVCDDAGRIRAGLPVVEIGGWLVGRRWMSLPYTDHCAPLCEDEEALAALTQALIYIYAQGRVSSMELRWELPNHEAIHSGCQHVRHSLRLDPGTQAVLGGFHRTHRQNIATAERRGVRIEWGVELAQLDAFYDLHLETRRRKGVPVQPRRFFDLIKRRVMDHGLGFILLAFKGSSCVAGGLFLYWHKTLTFKYAAASVEDQELRANNLLTWTAIRWACEGGLTLFDWGRTDLANNGLRRFKNGWGAEETPLVYSTLGHTPNRAADSTLKRIMGTVIRKSPAWVCRAAGTLYRYGA
jgi:CelD/BcsL family acetyltransferase involved in cellulose biosynthesis